MRLESKMKPGYEASREYFIVRCGFLRGIVTAHDGRIWAESEIGEGTRVVIELPLQA